jgi:hypothetical protein
MWSRAFETQPSRGWKKAFSKLFAKFLFGDLNEIKARKFGFPNFSLAVSGNINGLRRKKFGSCVPSLPHIPEIAALRSQVRIIREYHVFYVTYRGLIKARPITAADCGSAFA